MMQAAAKEYLVLPADEDLPGGACRIVTASSEEEAVAKYVRFVLALDETWLENIYTNSATLSFAERFFVESGVPLLDEQGEWRCTRDEARRIFETNVRKFFGVHAGWADLYLTFYFENRHRPWREARERWQFPPEMVGYMLESAGDSWCDILAIPLDGIARID